MKHSKPIILLITSFQICVIGFSQTESSQERSIGGIEAAALESDTKCPGILAALGKGRLREIGNGEHEIPPLCWSDATKELKPVRVYDHRLNIAIVIKIQDGKEEGIYVFNPVSSWFLIGENADGFEFNPKANGNKAIEFRRSIRRVDKSN